MILCLGFFCGCSMQGQDTGPEKIEPAGNGPGLRIISLAPSITEILFELGLDEEIAGVTGFCDYPDEAELKEKVGSFSKPNIERIIRLKPDIIFSTSLEQNPVVDKLKTLGYRVEVIYPQNMEELFSNIRDIGSYTNTAKAAEDLLEQMKTRLVRIQEKVKLITEQKRKRVFIEIWYEPITTVGPGSFVDELVTLAGGVNIAYDAPRRYSRFSPELVIRRDPEVIIMGYMDMKGRWAKALKERAGWGNIKAVQDNKVFDDLAPDLFLRPGPRAVIGVEEIYKRLYGSDNK